MQKSEKKTELLSIITVNGLCSKGVGTSSTIKFTEQKLCIVLLLVNIIYCLNQ